MNTETLIKVARYVLVATIVFSIVGLAGWYFVISRQTSAVNEISAGRGFGGTTPFFGLPGGSTLSNLLDGVTVNNSSSSDKERPRIAQLHPTAIAGFDLTGSSTVRYIDRSGYLYEADLAREKVSRLSNTLIPQLMYAEIRDTYVLGYNLDENGLPNAFIGSLVAPTTTNTSSQLDIHYLGNDVLDIQKVGDHFLMLVRGFASGSVLVQTALDGSSPEELYTSPLADWRLYATPERTFLLEKPITGEENSAFLITKDGREELLKDKVGMTLLPQASSTALLVSEDNGTLSLTGRVTDDTTFIPLPIRTITDKCAWAPAGGAAIAYCAVPQEIPEGKFLDGWYRGTVRTSDNWWKVDVSAGTAELQYAPTRDGLTMDVEYPEVDPTGSFIVFRNRIDGGLWQLKIDK